MSWDNPEISVCKCLLVHTIHSALESALTALIKMASSKKDSWEFVTKKTN